MSNYSAIYWLTRLDKIYALLSAVLILSIIVLVFYHIVLMAECYGDDDRNEYKKSYSKYRNISFFAGLLSCLLLVFMPTKNDLIIIYAGGKTMDFVQSDSSIAKIPYQTTSIISEYLDKSIKELKDKK